MVSLKQMMMMMTMVVPVVVVPVVVVVVWAENCSSRCTYPMSYCSTEAWAVML